MCDVTTYVTPTVGIVLIRLSIVGVTYIGGNITLIQAKQMTWHVINEEREACGNIPSYCNITQIKKR